MSKIIITLGHEHNGSDFDPCEGDGWKVHSFGRRHYNYSDPFDLGLDDQGDADSPDLARKLKEGLAFKLSYYEHGQCLWSLQGEGPQCRFDSVSLAGLLIWESDDMDIGAKTYEDRRKDAERFIEYYTRWANGECYWYNVERVTDCDACGNEKHVEDLDSCGGFIGHEAMFECLRENVDIEPDDDLEFRGEAAYLGDYLKEAICG